jgi:UV DNA damage endonuclease
MEHEVTQSGSTVAADLAPGEVHPATVSPSGRPEDATLNPESDEDVLVEADELKDALSRPPPVNSDYLPLPWKGRLGYVSTASRAVP